MRKGMITMGLVRLISRSLGVVLIVTSLTTCHISNFMSPDSAEPGSIIPISIHITDDVTPENEIVEGVLALLLPNDWIINTGQWESTLGSGDLIYDDIWSERASTKYPTTRFNPEMEWFAFITDSAFSYTDVQEFQADFTIQIGDSLALYQLACVATRNNHDGTGTWTKVSYPHFIGVPSLSDYTSYRVEAADEWTQLFYRDSGWVGADGTYPIPLDGNENYDPSPSRQTLINFSDTFIGQVSDEGTRLEGTQMVNNTQGILTGSQPIDENIRFRWGGDGENHEAQLVPATPNTEPGEWFWQMDGISLEDSIHIFLLRMESDDQWGFAIAGVVLASGVIGPDGQREGIEQIDFEVEYTNPSDNSQLVFGQAIMAQTVRSGCPNPDGYIYVYGPRSYSGGKGLVVARVLEASLSNVNAWSFWDGTDWSDNIADCADVMSGISQEHSVSQSPDGEYLLTFLRDGMSGPVCISRSPTPVGPFSYPEVIWTPPETDISPNIFTYNAKAHPHLSPPGELLISYEVNTFDFWEHFSNANIYHPRFIRMVYDNFVSIDEEYGQNAGNRPNKFRPVAYPNPFNGQVVLSFNEGYGKLKSIVIFDLTGKIVQKWEASMLSGKHEVSWDGKNINGEFTAAGVYLVQSSFDGGVNQALTKITLLK